MQLLPYHVISLPSRLTLSEHKRQNDQNHKVQTRSVKLIEATNIMPNSHSCQ